MNTFISCNSVLKCAVLATTLGLGALACAGEKAVVKADVIVPKSVFVDDANNGKDPFFPNSKRRLEMATTPRLVATNSAPPANSLFDQLRLKGISGTKAQPLALINSSTVGLGELAEIKCGLQIVKVWCREIRERSVLVELDGSNQIKELKLREGI